MILFGTMKELLNEVEKNDVKRLNFFIMANEHICITTSGKLCAVLKDGWQTTNQMEKHIHTVPSEIYEPFFFNLRERKRQ